MIKNLTTLLFVSLSGVAPAATIAATDASLPASVLFVPNPYTGGDVWLDAVALVDGDANFGVSLQGSYFLTNHFGLSADLTAVDSSYELGAHIVARYPIADLAVSPYILGGGGYKFDGDTQDTGYLDIGVGIRIALDDKFDLIADGRYLFVQDEEDRLEFRLGIGTKF